MSHSNQDIDAITEELRNGDIGIEDAIAESAKITTYNVKLTIMDKY